MRALVTGASSGIGYELAKQLSSIGYDLVIVSRDKKNLNKLKDLLKTEVEVIDMDLSNIDNCKKLHEILKDKKIDLLINNAGFGIFGDFGTLDLDRELNMVDLNVKALHTLTKLFLKDMIKNNRGKILNVASIAGFMPAGPLMSTYYATKAYVLSLTRGIDKELRKQGSKVIVSALCPGPVDTKFNDVAKVKFNMKPLTAEYVAKYTIKKLSKGKKVIIPGKISKLIYLASKIIPDRILLESAYRAQTKKI